MHSTSINKPTVLTSAALLSGAAVISFAVLRSVIAMMAGL